METRGIRKKKKGKNCMKSSQKIKINFIPKIFFQDIIKNQKTQFFYGYLKETRGIEKFKKGKNCISSSQKIKFFFTKNFFSSFYQISKDTVFLWVLKGNKRYRKNQRRQQLDDK